jgi:hypothetical protein
MSSTQLHAPFISVVNVNSESAPFAYDIGVDSTMPVVFDKTVNEYFTIKPDGFVV